MAARKRVKTKSGRLHLRVKEELMESMRAYAKRHDTNLTAITTKCFLELLKMEESMKFPEAEQV